MGSAAMAADQDTDNLMRIRHFHSTLDSYMEA